MKAEKSYFQGVMALTVASLAAKICGVLFKIPLFSVIGEEGMGYFNSAYVIYTFFYVFTTSGLPVGMSILVCTAVCEEERRLWLKRSLFVFGGAGALVCLIMMLFSGHLSLAIGNPMAKDSIFVLGPALLFVCLEGALRGYFQGKKNMLPTAVSQFLEAVIKTGVGLIAARAALKLGYDAPTASAAALLGIVSGGAISLIYLCVCVKRDHKRGSTVPGVSFCRERVSASRLLRVVLPVSGAASVMSVSSALDLSVVMHRLVSIGYTTAEANRLYGNYSGIALPMFNLPAMLFSPLSAALIPHAASASQLGKDPGGICSAALRAGVILTLPFTFLYFVIPGPLLDILFESGAAYKAAPLLRILSLSVCPVAITTVTGGILQASGKRIIPILSIASGAITKLVSVYFLIGKFGIAGAAMGTVLCYLVSAGVNLIALALEPCFALRPVKTFILPFFCALLSGAAVSGIRYLTGNVSPFGPILAAACGCGVCAGSLFLTRCIDRHLLELLPFSGKLKQIKGNKKDHERKSKGSHQGTLYV